MQWQPVIGLEVHIQLATKTKLFSTSSTAFGAQPNTQANEVDLGLPGVLPVLNKEAVKMAIRFGLAIDATIAKKSVFARKNYFYPDLPKGYQISQYEEPVVHHGKLAIAYDDTEKTINITRAHLEEDAGKSLHDEFASATAIDLNRAGVALLEIVSEPELASAAEAVAYLKKINNLVRYLGISDGDMSQGSMRCDANVSVRSVDSTQLGTRTEIKNVNSFRFVEKAINYEIARQIQVLEAGKTVTQETRLYDSEKNQTRSMRSKEEANDYRYFPDPDLQPIVITDDLLEDIRRQMPELPEARQARFIQLGLGEYEARLLASEKSMGDYFEQVLSHGVNSKLAANWLLGEFSSALNADGIRIQSSPLTAKQLAQLLHRIEDNTISGKIAKTLFEQLWNTPGDVDALIEKSGLQQVTDSAQIAQFIDTVLEQNPQQVSQYQQAAEHKRDRMIGFFVGQVMKLSRGKANPSMVNNLLQKKLASH